MKNVKTFNEFINESNEYINEGKDQQRLNHLRKFGIAPNNQPQNGAYIKSVSKPGKFFVDWKDAFKLGDIALEFIKSSGSESVFDIIDLKTMKRTGKQYSIKKGDLGNLRTTYGVRVSESINEGTLAKQGVAKLSDYSLDGAHDSDMKEFDEKLSKLLGEKDYKKIIQVDTESGMDDNSLNSKIFDYLESNFNGSGVPGMTDYVQDFNYDKKLNVAKIDDYGFIGYLFTAKSKF